MAPVTRYRAAQSCFRPPEHVGELDTWDDGVIMCDDVQMRQISYGSWDEQTWISADGQVRLRTFDPVSEAWGWSNPRSLHMSGDDVTVDIGSGFNRKRVRLARALALAWVHCPACAKKPNATFLYAPTDMLASNVGWREAGATRRLCEASGAEVSDITPSDEHTWVPLKCVWTSANGDVLEVMDCSDLKEFFARKDGWVYSSLSGQYTRGRRDANGIFWVGLAEHGLADMRDILRATFAQGFDAPRKQLSPSVVAAISSLAQGLTLSEWQAVSRCKTGSLWNQLIAMAREADFDTATTAWRIVPNVIKKRAKEPADFGISIGDELRSLRMSLPQSHVLNIACDVDAYGMMNVHRALKRREALRCRHPQCR